MTQPRFGLQIDVLSEVSGRALCETSGRAGDLGEMTQSQIFSGWIFGWVAARLGGDAVKYGDFGRGERRCGDVRHAEMILTARGAGDYAGG